MTTNHVFCMPIHYPMKSLLLTVLLLHCIMPTFAQTPANNTLTLTIDAKHTAQRIENFGASGCWYSEWIGKYWPVDKREKIAELLFSTQTDIQGNPLGIALSAWRFNIGGGTAEQGDKSGIKDVRKRVESFLSADGTYDWNKQQGYQWFLRKAKIYGVKDLIAFSNTPPVYYTQNGYGFKTEKSRAANLKADKYPAYANFLATVLAHFGKEGIRFNYISPVNEPQWDWFAKHGEMNQEGTPWTNEEINRVITELDKSLESKKLRTSILAPEAATLSYLYEGKTAAASQIHALFGTAGQNILKNLKHWPGIIAGHSYFTDTGDSTMVAVRQHLADTAAKYRAAFWQSEYSMLGDGFREGTGKKRTAMDCALFLAKVINRDLTIGNAQAWQFWNAYEPGSADENTRYYLIALHPNDTYTDGDFTPTKNLWALGNYSRFVRPGMQRVYVERSDGLTDAQTGQDIMASAFTNKQKQLVIVLINYTNMNRELQLNLKNFKLTKQYKTYITSADAADNMKASVINSRQSTLVKARSVTTIVLN
jgi:O-glycosyl hydrolase